MLNNLKPIGGFIENTIRPLLDEVHWIFEELDKKGIKVTEENVIKVTKELAKAHIISLSFELLKTIITATIICYTLFKISQSSSLL